MTQAVAEVRALLDESAPAFWTNYQIQSWVNQGCEDVARRGQTLWQEAALAITPGVQNYAFPGDFLNAHRADFSPSNSDQTYSLEFREINAMDEIWGILHSLPAAWPQYFTIRGVPSGYFLMLYPSPGAAGTLTVYYYRQAVAVQGYDNADALINTVFIDCISGWEDIVYDYAIYKALRAAKDSTWQEAYQLYESNIGRMIDKTRNMTDLGSVITSGIANWPTYTYADNGGW